MPRHPAPTRTSGATLSSWYGTAPVWPRFEPLRESTSTDVVVVGGGIAGLTTAYLLSKEGLKVLVLEDGELASGESGRTTAHLSNALDEGYVTLEHLFGAEGARLAAESHTTAIDTIERIVLAEGIECGFTRLDGYLFLPEGGTTQELTAERDAAHRAGLTDVAYLPSAGLVGFDTGECLHWPQQGQFHILPYLAGLAAAITRRGGRICTHTHVSEVYGGTSARVLTEDGAEVKARKAIVVATNTPFNDRVVLHTKQAAYRTYVVAARVPKGSVARALYWDTADPYHYIRIQEDPTDLPDGQPAYDLLLVGGEDHKTGQDPDPEARLRCLEAWVRARFAMVTDFAYRWSGQVMEPQDGLAFAGRNPLDTDNVFVITGDSGHGMTHGTLGPLLIADLIQGRSNPWAALYDPARITMQRESVQEFLKENVNVALEYTALLTGGDVATAADIPAGAGAVLRRGLSKVAVYKDEQGTTHECSALCPHLGCVVHWNSLEKSWDCPCHGSRFTALGELLSGPANTGLAAL